MLNIILIYMTLTRELALFFIKLEMEKKLKQLNPHCVNNVKRTMRVKFRYYEFSLF